MPKVAHFIDSLDPGGAETIVIEISRKIKNYGYTPEVYHFGNPWLEQKCEEYSIPSLFVPGHRFFTSKATIPIFSAVFAKFLKNQRVDVLHSHLFGSITGACFSAYLARIPHIGTLHDIYTIEEKKKRIRYIQLASFFGTRLVTVSHQMKTYLNSLGYFRNGTFQTIVNGVDIERFSLNVNRKDYPVLDLSPRDFIFICAGRLERIKGHDILLKAFSKIKPKDHVKLLIVGEGPCRHEIEKYIAEEELQHNVRMLGHREDIPALLKLSDCFVLSSYSEGLSCSIIEAMAAGLPVIATDVGGNSELIKDGIDGYLVPSDNPELLSKRLQAIIDDSLLRSKFSELSMKRVREYCSLDAMLSKYANSYNEIIDRKSV
jgi:glycosyltransferase involved in cell wall biosynthesis